MKIRLAILENDKIYLNRIVSVFSTRYAEKLEIYSFTDLDVAYQTFKTTKIDVLICNESYEIDFSKLPKRCGFAYFVESMGIDSINNHRAICKYQKSDLIYKQVLSIYSEIADNITGLKIGDNNCKIIAFSSPCGGTGTSIMAAACAVHFASQGKKALYLNLEKYGVSDTYFSAEGQFNMSDVIFALKSKKSNLSMKLESCVKQDAKGVCFFSQTKVALDMLELKTDDILHLIAELKIDNSYDYIILDTEYGIDSDHIKILNEAYSIIIVGDGSQSSNIKISRACNALNTIEQSSDSTIMNRMGIIYNKFSNKTSKTVENIDIRNIGGVPRFEHASEKQVIEQLSKMSMFDKIIE